MDLRLDLTASLGRPRAWSEWTQRRKVAACFSPDPLVKLIEEEGVDLLVIDIEEHEAMIAALAMVHGPPVAVLNSFFNLAPSTTTPPLHSPLQPGDDLATRVRIIMAWISGWVSSEKDSLYRRLRAENLRRPEVLRTVAARQGVLRSMTRWQWLRPFAPKRLPVLQTTASELELPLTLAKNVHQIGPLLGPIAVSAPIEDDAIRAAVETAKRNSMPVVVCAFGSFMAGEDDFLDRLAAATRLRPGIQFVVADDGNHQRWRDATNVVVRPWLPQRQLLALSAAAIVHTGLSTFHECVAASVPSVVYPLAFNDQPGNAARIEYHGLGVVGDRERDTAEIMVTRLDQVLDDTQIGDRLRSLSVAIARYDIEMIAVRAVEQLLDPT
jgi:UDP:flavonoid glycosyltransferase YjiC (YdhE family)